MTARGIGIFTIEFPDPLLERGNRRFVTLGNNISFQYPINSNIQTLTTKNVERGNDPFGILYVPDLQSEECKSAEQEYAPANVTRLAQLPQVTNCALIAVAPWFSASCIEEYFQAARNPQTKAFFTYQPGESNTMPPPMSDASWNLNDGGAWKVANTFPTYAIISIGGREIMQQLGQYSGNITDAPHSDRLKELFDPSDYVRLWATVNTKSGSELPSLWVFLVIVLGLLILVVVATSSFMHFVQRRRRNDLRQRVLNGEVNLEALGVKRLTVPQECLDKLALYTYTGPDEEDFEKDGPQEPAPVHQNTLLARRSSAPAVGAPTIDSPSFSQSTCPICLDDFESRQSQVRELPCRHIFHSDCIDTFLLTNSSLCPMCKTSVLPEGYCPARITNAMVRRERMIQRMRRNAAARASAGTSQPAVSTNTTSTATPATTPMSHSTRGFGSLGSRIGGAITGRRVFSAPERTQPPPDIEMGTSNPAPTLSSVPEATSAEQSQPVDDCPQAAATQNRREWARQRALALLGNQHTPANDEEEDRGSRWKRGLRKIFPGFR